MRLLTLFFDQNLLLWRCGELNSGLKGIILELYHYSQLWNLDFYPWIRGEKEQSDKLESSIFPRQGFGILLKTALLLAGVSSKVSYWLESLSVSFNKFSSRKERFCWVSIFCLIDFMLSDHRAMAIEDYGFLPSNPKSPPLYFSI